MSWINAKYSPVAAGSCHLDQQGAEGRLGDDGGGAEAQRHQAGRPRHVRHGRVGQAEEGWGQGDVMRKQGESYINKNKMLYLIF